MSLPEVHSPWSTRTCCEVLAVRIIPVPGCFAQIDMKNRFTGRRVFKAEILEICEFVWSNRIFPEVFSAMAFDWSHQIAKRICNEGAEVEQGVVPWNRKISKIENFMKY